MNGYERESIDLAFQLTILGDASLPCPTFVTPPKVLESKPLGRMSGVILYREKDLHRPLLAKRRLNLCGVY